jgi:hypothetical protein
MNAEARSPLDSECDRRLRGLVAVNYTCILWHQLTGDLRRRWANKSLNTFTEALEAFRTAMSCAIF